MLPGVLINFFPLLRFICHWKSLNGPAGRLWNGKKGYQKGILHEIHINTRFFPCSIHSKAFFYLFWLSVAEHCDEHSQTHGVLPQLCACWQGNFAFREGFRYDLLCEPFKWCPCPMTRFVNKTTWPDVNLLRKRSFSLNDWAARRGVLSPTKKVVDEEMCQRRFSFRIKLKRDFPPRSPAECPDFNWRPVKAPVGNFSKAPEVCSNSIPNLISNYYHFHDECWLVCASFDWLFKV